MSSNIYIQRICTHCHSEFMARTTVTKFCSEKCAKRAYKLRIKIIKIEKSEIETEIVKKQLVEPIMDKEFLSILEASKLLGVSRTTLWRLVSDEKLKVTKIGRRSIFRKIDINNLFK
ncbi:MAG: helix-turn-helix domain-containing protein [Arcicella sp.]|nr:helix-turn-helix domain-containing protein [Arcicella sp.]